VGAFEGLEVDDRAKAAIAIAVAAVLGIGGVLAVEAATGFRPGAAPAASTARFDVPGATATPPISSPMPSTVPKLVPTAKPTPTAPPWKATWSKPRRVDKESCGEFAVGIDASSQYHVITSCDLRYSVTNADGQWTTTSLGDSKAHEPLIAFDGDQAYIAYWRELPWDADTCGGRDSMPPSAGVYYRKRTLPDGGWSKAIPFGALGDHLTAFRVDGGVLHAIVLSGNSERLRSFYIRSTQNPVVSARHKIDGVRDVSLRVGDDGRARVAYGADGSLRYGTFNGSGFSTSKISDGPTNGPPMLILGPGDQPHVVYTITPPTQGCGDAEPLSRAGTYYATMVNGKWSSQRITKHLALVSFALDPGTGRVHVIEGNTLYTKESSRAWASARLPAGVERPVMRLDPATGELLLVYLPSNPDGESDGLFAITSR
jgi:hypothetical protein